MAHSKQPPDGNEVAALTLEVLKGMRTDLREGLSALRVEVQKTNERLDTTVARLDTTNERLERLEKRQSATEIRLGTELVAVANAVGQVITLLETAAPGP